MAGKNSKGPFVIELHVKDPDAFGEIVDALGEEKYGRWFEFAEYATLQLVCEIKNGKPVVVSGTFKEYK